MVYNASKFLISLYVAQEDHGYPVTNEEKSGIGASRRRIDLLSGEQRPSGEKLPSYQRQPLPTYSHAHSSSTSGLGATTGYIPSWKSTAHKGSTRHKSCKGKHCDKDVHYEPGFGNFDYCSPQCRDDDLLQDSKTKLQKNLLLFQ